MIYPALTIRQPWATALVDPDLPKTIETRSRRIPAKYLGVDVAIIAGAHPINTGHLLGEWWVDLADDGTPFLARPIARLADWVAVDAPLGRVVGIVRFVECLPISDRANYGSGRGVDAWWQDNAWSLGICEDGVGPGAPRHMVEHRDDDYDWGDYTPGRWAWVTDPAYSRLVTPQPAKGALHWQQIEVA
jgi:hypothetical protein